MRNDVWQKSLVGTILAREQGTRSAVVLLLLYLSVVRARVADSNHGGPMSKKLPIEGTLRVLFDHASRRALTLLLSW